MNKEEIEAAARRLCEILEVDPEDGWHLSRAMMSVEDELDRQQVQEAMSFREDLPENITFYINHETIMEITPEGLFYKDELAKDAGECYKAVMKFMGLCEQ